MTPQPFDVVIPARDAAGFITAAIRSARAAGAQSVIVVDDGSTDDTHAIAVSLGCLTTRLEGLGAAKARRAGLALVTAPVVAYLDADDELIERGVAASLAILETRADAIGVLGATVLDGGQGGTRTMTPPRGDVTLASLVTRGHAPGPPGAFLWRRRHDSAEVLRSVEPLDPGFAEDYELVLRSVFAGSIVVHDRPTVRYRTGVGKSTAAPLRGLRDAERLRTRYATIAGIEFAPRSERLLRALVMWRLATEPATGHSMPRRLRAALGAFVTSPAMVLDRVWRREARRG